MPKCSHCSLIVLAALYAHSRRHMEDDSKSSPNCKDIARQLIEDEPGRKLNVIMGGGLRSLISHSEPPGRRKDERNLTGEWIDGRQRGEYVTDRSEMLNISLETEHVMGIFASSHMHFNADRDRETEPSLAEMTQTAIKVLKRNNARGFLLIVEAGKIDLAHHYNNAYRALDDTLALDEAVEVAVRSVGKTIEEGPFKEIDVSNFYNFRLIGFINHRDVRPRVIDCVFWFCNAKRLVNSGNGQVCVEH